ncbi:unnamed protein product [Cylindrotheca closterium]|uniref:Cytosol aminopeptidase domain-containing protein n=1 Tax=Cylindrotheca closterium TaxID=2856 RepID=A0AAD2CS58_9STRA|nr:unnamed protein product [Cylindrotheca closterium]
MASFRAWRGFPQLLLCLSTTTSVSSFLNVPAPQARGLATRMMSPSRSVATSFYSTSLHASTAADAGTSNAPTLDFVSSLPSMEDYNSTVIIGKKSSLDNLLMSQLVELLGLQDESNSPIVETILKSIGKKKGGSSSTFLSSNNKVHKLSIGGLPSELSRHNHPMAVHSLTRLVGSLVGTSGKGSNTRVVVLTDDHPIGPLAMAMAKAFPLFSKKSKTQASGDDDDEASDDKKRTISIVFCKSDGTMVDGEAELKAAQVAAAGVQLAARLVDSHPALLTTSQYAKEIQSMVDDYNKSGDKPKVEMKQIVGNDLKQYGGLYGVGQAANCPPRLVLLEYDGTNGSADAETVALVGKGIVYDTGGLSLKTRAGMAGMKHDMGGSAGVFAGFWSAVQLGVPKKVHCILCLAENAIGPDAFRNDDILDMYSGKTVEVNNCDAEGRLVLADGVAHATKHIDGLDLVVDMATLTGAQLVATGKKHAGILANTEELENRAMAAGMHSGDLVYPLLYSPELLMDEFKSEVADMKNSVKDRSNAQTSCAGHFIEAHLDKDYKNGWLHVDMAGPGTNGQRGTGYGVGLVLSLLDAPGF